MNKKEEEIEAIIAAATIAFAGEMAKLKKNEIERIAAQPVNSPEDEAVKALMIYFADFATNALVFGFLVSLVMATMEPRGEKK
jgi:hypothetical protein